MKKNLITIPPPTKEDIRDFKQILSYLNDSSLVIEKIKARKNYQRRLTEIEKESYANIRHKIAMLSKEMYWLMDPSFDKEDS